ncbi:hypothetical protein [Tannerella forsythia]|uniref:hypothetical protein n=1 Tax=Tannerella forsythia TaxID=28112 RepID=UPI000A63F391|nr:hypothetical protein [Tannerella forsythia]
MDLNTLSPLAQRDLRNLERMFKPQFEEIESQKERELFDIERQYPVPVFTVKEPVKPNKSSLFLKIIIPAILILILLFILHLIRLLLGLFMTISWDTWEWVKNVFYIGSGLSIFGFIYDKIKNQITQSNYNDRMNDYHISMQAFEEEVEQHHQQQAQRVAEIESRYNDYYAEIYQEYELQQNAIISKMQERNNKNRNIVF